MRTHARCVLAVCALLASVCPAWAAPGDVSVDVTAEPQFPIYPKDQDIVLPGLIDVGARLPVRVELKYGSTDNFMGRDVYGGLKRCFLVEDAARMLEKAHALLKARAPELTFVMYDCARPKRVQVEMWNALAGTKQQGYVANPHKVGSIHSTGCAVDLSLWNTAENREVDMGTPFDFFGPKAEPRREVDQWKAGALTSMQWANRLLLREVMLRAGFRVLPHEWWHFDCAEPNTARRTYKRID